MDNFKGMVLARLCRHSEQSVESWAEPKNYIKRCAFTLSELLLSLIIVGVVAIITVPVLINNVQKKVFATQLKNMVATIEQLAQDELITHRTRDLSNTDFAAPETLLTSKHFNIVKFCPPSNALTDCWKTNVSGRDKVQYKLLNKSNDSINAGNTIILKNGVMLRYSFFSGRPYFLIDINGNDKPNISGRDLFGFILYSNGQIYPYCEIVKHANILAEKINACKSDTICCTDALIDNNWKMDY